MILSNWKYLFSWRREMITVANMCKSDLVLKDCHTAWNSCSFGFLFFSYFLLQYSYWRLLSFFPNLCIISLGLLPSCHRKIAFHHHQLENSHDVTQKLDHFLNVYFSLSCFTHCSDGAYVTAASWEWVWKLTFLWVYVRRCPD